MAALSKEFVTPKSLFEAAKVMMLDGKEPITDLDWIEIARFLAVNIDERMAETGTCLVLAIFGCTLKSDLVRYIVRKQIEKGSA